jgi:hypothetical protein
VFIVWGKKNRFPLKGHAALFCPFCRELRASQVREMRSVDHLYYVPIGKGEVVGYRLDCAECGAPQYFQSPPVAAIVDDAGTGVEGLVAATNPTIRQDLQGRLELEDEIRSGRIPTDPETRMGLLFEPFEVLSAEMEAGCAETRIDLQSTLGCLGTIVALPLAAFAAGFLADTLMPGAPKEEVVIVAFLSAGVLGLIVTLWQLHRSARRWVEKRMAPHLRRAFEPLRPTRREIEGVMNDFREDGYQFPRHLRIEALFPHDPTSATVGTIDSVPIEPR